MTKKFKISFIAILILIITIPIMIISFKQDDLKSTDLNLNEKITASYGIEIESLKYDVLYNNSSIDLNIQPDASTSPKLLVPKVRK